MCVQISADCSVWKPRYLLASSSPLKVSPCKSLYISRVPNSHGSLDFCQKDQMDFILFFHIYFYLKFFSHRQQHFVSFFSFLTLNCHILFIHFELKSMIIFLSLQPKPSSFWTVFQFYAGLTKSWEIWLPFGPCSLLAM